MKLRTAQQSIHMNNTPPPALSPAEIDELAALLAKVHNSETDALVFHTETVKHMPSLIAAARELRRVREVIREYLDVLDNAPDESCTSDLRTALSREVPHAE